MLAAACGGNDGNVAEPAPDETIAPTTTAPPPPPATVLAVADAADCRGPDTEVAELIESLEGTLLMAGDLAYKEGSIANFTECFLPLYGGDLDRLYAVPGDNDYGTGNPDAFFQILGDRVGEVGKGWFTAELGSWQLIGLNSECGEVGGCDPESEQYQWLAQTLAEAPADQCRIAMWHLPRFTSSANYQEIPRLGPMYELLFEAGTDILLAGNSHHYERFEPLGPDGLPAEGGISNFTIGIGGATFTQFGEIRQGSAARQNDTRGVVRFELAADEWSFEFVPVPSAESGFTDSGTIKCNNA